MNTTCKSSPLDVTLGVIAARIIACRPYRSSPHTHTPGRAVVAAGRVCQINNEIRRSVEQLTERHSAQRSARAITRPGRPRLCARWRYCACAAAPNHRPGPALSRKCPLSSNNTRAWLAAIRSDPADSGTIACLAVCQVWGRLLFSGSTASLLAFICLRNTFRRHLWAPPWRIG